MVIGRRERLSTTSDLLQISWLVYIPTHLFLRLHPNEEDHHHRLAQRWSHPHPQSLFYLNSYYLRFCHLCHWILLQPLFQCYIDYYLSSRDPISIPVMTANFKRLASVIGPVFWLQDRIEEIILWKRGWLNITAWMASYVFLYTWPFVKARCFNTPSTSSHDWNNIGDVPVSFDFIVIIGSCIILRIVLRHRLFLQFKTIPWQSDVQGIQNLIGVTWVTTSLLFLFPFSHDKFFKPILGRAR